MAKAASLQAARQAKTKVLRSLKAHPNVVGVGIARADGGYQVKVNLARSTGVHVPSEVDGVPVFVETVGRIAKRQAAR
jgi:hypothetical protein